MEVDIKKSLGPDEAHEESLQAVATVFRAIIVRVVFGFHRGQLADRDLEIGPRYGVRRLKADATFIWLPVLLAGADAAVLIRSEERRVGKECVSTCRSRWWPYLSKHKYHDNISVSKLQTTQHHPT